jgi:hypothetical protein
MAFGIDMGPSQGEQSNYGSLVSSAGAATQLGESDLDASSKFMQAILSGDASKISQALAPQISSAKTSAQQTNKTNAEMGTRSGGTAASTTAANDKVHSDITNLIGGLTGSSASSLGSEGSGLLSEGMSGNANAFGEAQTMQQQRASKWNDLFGNVAGIAGGVVAGLPGSPGSAQDAISNGLSGY